MKESRRLQIKLGFMLLPLLPLYLWLYFWLLISKASEAVEGWNNGWANNLGQWLEDHGYPLADTCAQLRAARYKENRVKEEADRLHR